MNHEADHGQGQPKHTPSHVSMALSVFLHYLCAGRASQGAVLTYQSALLRATYNAQ
jgi:hypothetical protein